MSSLTFLSNGDGISTMLSGNVSFLGQVEDGVTGFLISWLELLRQIRGEAVVNGIPVRRCGRLNWEAAKTSRRVCIAQTNWHTHVGTDIGQTQSRVLMLRDAG